MHYIQFKNLKQKKMREKQTTTTKNDVNNYYSIIILIKDFQFGFHLKKKNSN